MVKYPVEFFGTFFAVATIGGAVLSPGGAGDIAPLAAFVFERINPEDK